MTEPIVSIFARLRGGVKQTVVVYGTSLTEGGAWAEALKQWFEDHFPGQVTFVNSGGSGMNSDWGLENLQTRVLDYCPNLVFIEFSYNDAHDKFAMPPERGAVNLDQMVQRIRAKNPETGIVLQIMNIGWDAPNGNRSSSVRPELEKFNENYRRYATAHGLFLIDHYPVWRRLKQTEPDRFREYIPDGSHPTAEASIKVTWPSIKALLETLHRDPRLRK